MCFYLEKQGHTPMAVHSAREALACIESFLLVRAIAGLA